MTKQVLYISGSLGLGHAVRDLAIANALRARHPDIAFTWLAAHPANTFLEESGETMHPQADLYANDTASAEAAAKGGFRLNLVAYLNEAMQAWEQNVRAFKQVIGQKSYDLVIADEAYEISDALDDEGAEMDAPFVMLYDCLGNVAMSWNPLERLGTYLWNRAWAKTPAQFADEKRLALFLGEPEDVPDRSLGPFLPRAREVAERAFEFVGYVLHFDPREYANSEAVKAGLGYGEAPLVIVAIGGTSVGKELLELCGQAYPLAREQIPDLRMVLVAGPRLDPESLILPKGVEVRGYVPHLYEHFAACDLAIVQSGGTSTLELTALQRPFLYFPLEGHFEQQVYVAGRLARHRAGVKMSYRKTRPETLATRICSHLGREVHYAQIPTDGAQRAARFIGELLQPVPS